MPYLPPSNDSDYILDIDSDQIEDSQDDSYENTADYKSYEYTGPSDIGVPDPDSSSETPDPIPTNEIRYKVTYKDRRPLDSTEPSYLEELYDSGAKFYAIYDDDTEEEVSWTEIEDLDPLETEIDLSTAIASASNQHFWDDTNGVHVSEVAKEDWNTAVADNFSDLSSSKNYYNILMNSLGLLLRRALYNLVSINRAAISFYDGLGNESSNIMASFGRNSAQIGRSAGKHVVIDNDGITAYDGNQVAPLNASNITAAEANIQQLQADTADISTIRANSAKVQSLTAEALTAATAYIAALNTASVTANDISANKATLGTLISGNVTTDTLRAASAYISSLVSSNISASTLTADHASLGTVVADYLKSTDMEAERARVATLIADYATVIDLNAATARIGDLEADHVSVSDFEAEQANIDQLQADTADIDEIRANSAKVENLTAAQLEADHATVGSLSTTYATITNLNAATGRISDLESTRVRTTDLEANYITADAIEAAYTKTDLSNTDVAWIQNGTIKNGAITNAMINSVSANKLTAGTIDASVINVTNLQADDISVTRINGQTVSGKTLVDALEQHEDDISDLDTKIDTQVEALNDRIDGAIETFTGTAVPTLTNSPASSWNTTKLKDQHVGDVYYVVNSSSQQNGYCYRFTKSGSSYSWQLIKDSDVTAALSRLQTAEGKITTFDSDISQLKTDTGTLTTKTQSLETRMSDAENDILDKVDTTTFNEVSDTVDGHTQSISQMSTTLSNKADSSTVSAVTQRVSKNEQDISGINTTIGTMQSTIASKADGSTVETISTKLNTVSDTVDGHTQSISSINSTLSTKADSSTVSTLSTKVNTIEDTVDGHTQSLQSVTSTQTSIQQNAVKSTVQLWFTKANTTAPNKPTAHVTTNNAATGNAWNLAVPTYNASYPNYYYCYEYEFLNGTYGWSAVTRDIATGEMQERARTAITNAAAADTKAGNAATAAANAQADIDNLDVGGRNLVRWSASPEYKGGNVGKSSDSTGWYAWNTSTTGVVDTNDGIKCVFTGNSTGLVIPLVYDNAVLGDEVLTISFDYRGTLEAVGSLYLLTRSGGNVTQSGHTPPELIVSETNWQHYEYTFTFSSLGNRGATHSILLPYTSSNGKWFEIKDRSFKLEKGNRATDWTPAPEDVDADISTAQTAADTAQATADKNVKESIQLWITKASSSVPAKPTSKVTSTAVSGNAWTTKVPTYNSTYPYYFYCMQYIAADGTVTWSDVVYDQATTEAQNVARTATTNLSTLQQDYATFKQTTQNFESTIGSTYATKTEVSAVQTNLDNLEIGGRNLLPWSLPSADNMPKVFASSASLVTEDGYSCYKIEGGSTNGSQYGSASGKAHVLLEANTQYVYSAIVKVTTTTSATSIPFNFSSLGHFSVINSASTASDKTHEDIPSERVYTPSNITIDAWTKIQFIFTTNALNNSRFGLYPKYALGSEYIVFIRNQKLEKGNKATDWTPAPEDVDAAIDMAPKYKYVTSAYDTSKQAYSTWLNWSTEGSPINNFVLATSEDYNSLNVGDIACCKGTNSTDNKPIYILIEVTSKNGNIRISGIAHGLIDPQIRTTVNNIESRVTSAETSITQNNEAIALKANASDVYTKSQTDGLISTEVSNRNSAIEQSAAAINLSVSQNYTTKTESKQLIQPNLTPFFAQSKSSTVYWRNSNATVPAVTSDWSFEQGGPDGLGGWAHLSVNNTSSNVTYAMACIDKDALQLKASTKYTFLLEWANVTISGSSNFYATSEHGGTGGSNNDFFSSTAMYPITSGSNTKYYAATTRAELETNCNNRIRAMISIGNGTSIDGYFRLSVYEGDYTGLYKPYIGTQLYPTETEFNEAKAEIKVTTDGISSTVEKISSTKYLTSAYLSSGWTLSNIRNYAAEGSTQTFTVVSTNDVRVGDTVYIKGMDSTRVCNVYIKGTVTLVVNATQLVMTSHGYEDVLPVETIKSTINQSADSVKIQARHVEIDGTAIFSNTAFRQAADAAYDAKGSANAVQTNLDNLKIGGRNLYILRDAVAGYIATSGENKGGVVLSPAYPQHSTSDFVEVSAGDIFTFQMWNPNLTTNTGNSNRTVTWYDSDKNYISYHNGGGDAATSGPKGKAYWTWTCNPAPNGAAYARFGFVIGPQNSIDPDIKVKVERGNKPTDWTPTPEDQTADTVKRTHRIYYRKSAVSVPATPSTAAGNWVTQSGDVFNQWTTKVPRLTANADGTGTKYLYLYTCEQHEMGDGKLAYTTVLLDDSTTIIDGGNIITGTVSANAINASSGTFNTANIPNLSADKITSGTIDAARIDASSLTIGYSQINNTPTIPTKVSDLTNDSGYQTSSQVNTAITSKGYQTSSQVETAITNKGYQTSSQVETAITSKGYATTGQAQGYANDAVNNLSIGGRNLLRGTAAMKSGGSSGSWGAGTFRGSGGGLSNVTTSGFPLSGVSGVLRITNTGSSSANIGFAQDSIPGLVTGETYTESGWIRASANMQGYLQPIWHSTTQTTGASEKNLAFTTDWKWFSFTGELKGDQANLYSGGYAYALSCPSGGWFEVCGLKLEKGTKPTDWTPAPEDQQDLVTSTRSWYATCDTAAATVAKEAATTDSGFDLHEGVVVDVKFTNTNSGAVGSLTLNVNGTGAKSIKTMYNNSLENLTTAGQLYAGLVVRFVYSGTYWIAQTNYNSDTYNRMRWQGAIKVLEQPTGTWRILCGTESGYVQIGASKTFDLAYPILAVSAQPNANTTTDTGYLSVNALAFSNTAAIQSGAANKTIYLKGSVSGNTFTIDATNVFTTVVPTSEDGCAYIPLGILTNATTGYFKSSKDLYAYKDGAFGPISIREASAAAKTATNYITADANGIKIHMSGNSTTYQHQTASGTTFYVNGKKRSTVGADGLKVYIGDTAGSETDVASFGTTARIGSQSAKHLLMRNTGVTLMPANGESSQQSLKNISDFFVDQDTYLDDPLDQSSAILTGLVGKLNNLLSTPSGLVYSVGDNDVLIVTGSGAQIGSSSNSNVSLDYHSMKMVDKDGDTYFHVSDLRGPDGTLAKTDRFVGDGSTKRFNLTYQVASTNYAVYVSDSSGETVSKQLLYVEFSSPPTNGAIITVEYTTTVSWAKAYTLGTRGDGDVGAMSVATGFESVASGEFSHTEGIDTTASGSISHAEGGYTTASGSYSHAQNYYTHASGRFQTTIGRYNDNDPNNAFEIGNGTANNARANALTVDWSGNLTLAGGITLGTTLADSNLPTKGSAGTAGTSSATSGATLAIPYITTDAYGRVTSKGTHTHTINSLAASAIGSGTFDVDRLPTVTRAKGGTGVTAKQSSSVTVTTANATAGSTNYCWHNGVVATVTLNCTLKAALANGSSVTVGTVPSGYRPAATIWSLCYTTTSIGPIGFSINSSGTLSVVNRSGSSLATSVTLGISTTYCI